MNDTQRQNIREIAELIRKEEVGTFTMDCITHHDKEHDCSTPACVMGWTAYHICRGHLGQFASWANSFLAADSACTRKMQEHTGLTYKQYKKLFYPVRGAGCEYSYNPGLWEGKPIRKQHALMVLENLAVTGKVEWDKMGRQLEDPSCTPPVEKLDA